MLWTVLDNDACAAAETLCCCLGSSLQVVQHGSRYEVRRVPDKRSTKHYRRHMGRFVVASPEPAMV